MSGLSEPGQRNAGCQCAEIHLQGSGDKRCLGGIQRDPVEAQQLAGLLLQRVGIGGSQTGIYPANSPGGWQLIGRTPLRLFDPQGEPPSLLLPGDRIRFVPQEPDHA